MRDPAGCLFSWQVGKGQEYLSEKDEAEDRFSGWKIYLQYAEIGTMEPVFANICSTLRLDSFTLRGKGEVNTKPVKPFKHDPHPGKNRSAIACQGHAETDIPTTLCSLMPASLLPYRNTSAVHALPTRNTALRQKDLSCRFHNTNRNGMLLANWYAITGTAANAGRISTRNATLSFLNNTAGIRETLKRLFLLSTDPPICKGRVVNLKSLKRRNNAHLKLSGIAPGWSHGSIMR